MFCFRKLGLLWLCCLPLVAFATPKDTYEYNLANGLKLVIKEDHRAPVVVSQIWYHVGSSFEPGGLTGISHVLEHMMFKGTKKYPAGEFSKRIAAHGGTENAFTNADYTAYFQELSSANVELSIKLEADRMRGLLLPAAEFKKEIEVVKEERRMRVEDNPDALAYERFLAVAHMAKPYHHMVIGHMNDLQHLTVQDLRSWYDTWYRPNNATFVIVGDVDHEKIHRLVKQYFAAIPAQPLPTIKPQREPKGLGQRQVNVKASARLPLLYMGYNVPTLNTIADAKDAYALEMIAALLNAGESSRFARELVRDKQIAISASANYDLLDRFDALFTLSGKPSPKVSLRQLRQAFTAQIHRLQTTRVSDAELHRVKAQVLANKVYAKDSLFGQGMQIGVFSAVGLDWRIGEQYAENIQAVTASDVLRVAKQYLRPEQLTIATLEPEKTRKSS